MRIISGLGSLILKPAGVLSYLNKRRISKMSHRTANLAQFLLIVVGLLFVLVLMSSAEPDKDNILCKKENIVDPPDTIQGVTCKDEDNPCRYNDTDGKCKTKVVERVKDDPKTKVSTCYCDFGLDDSVKTQQSFSPATPGRPSPGARTYQTEPDADNFLEIWYGTTLVGDFGDGSLTGSMTLEFGDFTDSQNVSVMITNLSLTLPSVQVGGEWTGESILKLRNGSAQELIYDAYTGFLDVPDTSNSMLAISYSNTLGTDKSAFMLFFAVARQDGSFVVMGDVYASMGTRPIPTLTEWGMIIFSILLLGWMGLVIHRRRVGVVIGHLLRIG